MWRKIIMPGLVAGIAMLVTGVSLSWIYNRIFPQLANEYSDEYLFRPWSDPVMLWFFVHPIAVALLLAWIWDKVKDLFPSVLSSGEKAIRFALIYSIFSACGMLITYSTFPVSLLMVGSWLLSVFIEGIIGTWLLAKLNPSNE